MVIEKEGQCDWSQVSVGNHDGEMGSDRNSLRGRVEGRWHAARKDFGFHYR